MQHSKMDNSVDTQNSTNQNDQNDQSGNSFEDDFETLDDISSPPSYEEAVKMSNMSNIFHSLPSKVGPGGVSEVSPPTLQPSLSIVFKRRTMMLKEKTVESMRQSVFFLYYFLHDFVDFLLYSGRFSRMLIFGPHKFYQAHYSAPFSDEHEHQKMLS